MQARYQPGSGAAGLASYPLMAGSGKIQPTRVRVGGADREAISQRLIDAFYDRVRAATTPDLTPSFRKAESRRRAPHNVTPSGEASVFGGPRSTRAAGRLPPHGRRPMTIAITPEQRPDPLRHPDEPRRGERPACPTDPEFRYGDFMPTDRVGTRLALPTTPTWRRRRPARRPRLPHCGWGRSPAVPQPSPN